MGGCLSSNSIVIFKTQKTPLKNEQLELLPFLPQLRWLKQKTKMAYWWFTMVEGKKITLNKPKTIMVRWRMRPPKTIVSGTIGPCLSMVNFYRCGMKGTSCRFSAPIWKNICVAKIRTYFPETGGGTKFQRWFETNKLFAHDWVGCLKLPFIISEIYSPEV